MYLIAISLQLSQQCLLSLIEEDNKFKDSVAVDLKEV